jgi:hypothetical protein
MMIGNNQKIGREKNHARDDAGEHDWKKSG